MQEHFPMVEGSQLRVKFRVEGVGSRIWRVGV